MDVTDALYSRYSTRAFKPDSIDKKTITRILEAATRAPSWANTQPWEIFVAVGEVLNRLRHAYLENFHKGVSGGSDLPKPQQWPPALQKRMEELGAERFKTAGIGRDDKAARQAIFEANYRFFGAPVGLPVYGPHSHTVVNIRPRNACPEHYAGGATVWHGLDPCC